MDLIDLVKHKAETTNLVDIFKDEDFKDVIAHGWGYALYGITGTIVSDIAEIKLDGVENPIIMKISSDNGESDYIRINCYNRINEVLSNHLRPLECASLKVKFTRDNPACRIFDFVEMVDKARITHFKTFVCNNPCCKQYHRPQEGLYEPSIDLMYCFECGEVLGSTNTPSDLEGYNDPYNNL